MPLTPLRSVLSGVHHWPPEFPDSLWLCVQECAMGDHMNDTEGAESRQVAATMAAILCFLDDEGLGAKLGNVAAINTWKLAARQPAAQTELRRNVGWKGRG